MAFGYVDGETLIVYTFHKELGSGRGKSGSWWALIALDAIADKQEKENKPLTGWCFPASLQMAVERILRKHEYPFHLLKSKEECDKVLKLVFEEEWQEDLLDDFKQSEK